MLQINQEIEWDTKHGIRTGVIVDILAKEKNPHLRIDSYLVQSSILPYAFAVPVDNVHIRPKGN